MTTNSCFIAGYILGIIDSNAGLKGTVDIPSNWFSPEEDRGEAIQDVFKKAIEVFTSRDPGWSIKFSLQRVPVDGNTCYTIYYEMTNKDERETH